MQFDNTPIIVSTVLDPHGQSQIPPHAMQRPARVSLYLLFVYLWVATCSSVESILVPATSGVRHHVHASRSGPLISRRRLPA